MTEPTGPSFRHRVEYGAVLAVMTGVGLLPQRLALGLGSVIGWAFFALDAQHRRLTLRNLSRAFPERSPRELRRVSRAVFAHFGRLLVEVLRFSQLPRASLRERVEFVGVEHVRAALDEGRGVIFVAGHFGFWEIQGFAHGLELPPMSVVARPLDNPLLHVLLERARTRLGNSVIYRRGGLRRILRTLQANGIVAILIDQHIQTADAVMVDFFGRPAKATSAVAVLALRTGAPVVPVFAIPLPDGRYRLVYEPPVPPPAPGTPDAIREFTQRCTDVLASYVRRDPHLWLWMHRRWREADQDDTSRGMFPAGAPDADDASEPEMAPDE